MLSYRLTRNAAGITLIGEPEPFSTAHELLLDVNARSPLIRDEQGAFYQFTRRFGQAKTGDAPLDMIPRPASVRSVKVLWPVVLLHERMLRHSLDWMPYGARHEVLADTLEGIVRLALREEFGEQGNRLIGLWLRLNPDDPQYYSRLKSRGALFASWRASIRHARFAGLLESFHPFYRAIYETRSENDPTLPSPTVIEQWKRFEGEWPDPGW